jgi:hypothetical protein
MRTVSRNVEDNLDTCQRAVPEAVSLKAAEWPEPSRDVLQKGCLMRITQLFAGRCPASSYGKSVSCA